MSLLSSDDFPTFDRPANATSGHFGSGRHPVGLAIGPMNSRLRITNGSRVASGKSRVLEIRAFLDANGVNLKRIQPRALKLQRSVQNFVFFEKGDLS
jgi:hypothetical protein